MKIVLLFTLLLPAVGCQQPRRQVAVTRTVRAIDPEPLSQAVNVETFDGCEYDPTPMLAISPKLAMLDGVPVDEPGLETNLRQRHELEELLGGALKTDIVVQVDAGVSEKRVRRFLASARGAGFVNVTRLLPSR